MTLFCIACGTNGNQSGNSEIETPTVSQSNQAQQGNNQAPDTQTKNDNNNGTLELYISMDTEQYSEEELDELLAAQIPYIYEEIREKYGEYDTETALSLQLPPILKKKPKFSTTAPKTAPNTKSLVPATIKKPEVPKRVVWKEDATGNLEINVKEFELDDQAVNAIVLRKQRKEQAAAQKRLIDELTRKPDTISFDFQPKPRRQAPVTPQAPAVRQEAPATPQAPAGPPPAWLVYATGL